MNDFSERIKICGECLPLMKVVGQKSEFPKDGVLCRAWIRLTGARTNCQSEHINKRNPIGVKRYLLQT